MKRPPARLLRFRDSRAALSLVEILVVTAIFVVLAAMSLPAFSSLNSAAAINKAGETVNDQMVLARQQAFTRNRNVELRFIDLGEPNTTGYRALQPWIADERGVLTPLARLVRLPAGVTISDGAALSPLLQPGPSAGGQATFGGAGNRPYVAIRFRAGGEPETSITNANNFLTVLAETQRDRTPPSNYYVVRVTPLTGRISTYRP